jgi:hypothetical protein
LVTFDWGQPHFVRHDIEGIVLGPLPAVQNSGEGSDEIAPNTWAGADSALRIRATRVRAIRSDHAILMLQAPIGHLGWELRRVYLRFDVDEDSVGAKNPGQPILETAEIVGVRNRQDERV